MDARTKQLRDSIEVLVTLVRNIHLRRVLSDVCPDPQLFFWRVIYGDLTDIVVLEWCKLFGSDNEDHQAVHWKNLLSDHQKFRDDLFSQARLSKTEWEQYWWELKRYRDRAVAHHDPRRVEIRNYPTFDIALQSAYFYYGIVERELKTLGVQQYPADLRLYGDEFAKQCREVATVAMEATSSIREKVY